MTSTLANEQGVRDALERGDSKAATTLALELYGSEIFGFVRATAKAADADVAYAVFAEDVWRGIGGFEGRSSLRVWAYTVARRAVIRTQRERHRRRELLCDDLAWLGDVTERARSVTPQHLRSEVKRRVRKLRERLPREDQELLILRVDRGLSFKELAEILEPDDVATGDARARAAARLRKRFESVKNKLRRLAREDGLLSGSLEREA